MTTSTLLIVLIAILTGSLCAVLWVVGMLAWEALQLVREIRSIVNITKGVAKTIESDVNRVRERMAEHSARWGALFDALIALIRNRVTARPRRKKEAED